MARLTAFRFDTVDGADVALGVVPMLQEQQLITILDAALVSWPKGNNRPSTRQVVPPTATQLLDGTFWGDALQSDISFQFLTPAAERKWSD
jgi:uncharacterized membrane protein